MENMFKRLTQRLPFIWRTIKCADLNAGYWNFDWMIIWNSITMKMVIGVDDSLKTFYRVSIWTTYTTLWSLKNWLPWWIIQFHFGTYLRGHLYYLIACWKLVQFENCSKINFQNKMKKNAFVLPTQLNQICSKQHHEASHIASTEDQVRVCTLQYHSYMFFLLNAFTRATNLHILFTFA